MARSIPIKCGSHVIETPQTIVISKHKRMRHIGFGADEMRHFVGDNYSWEMCDTRLDFVHLQKCFTNHNSACVMEGANRDSSPYQTADLHCLIGYVSESFGQ